MWCFKGQKGLCIYILPNQKKSFGKSSDIKLEDATISRLHAIVSVESTGELDIQYKCVINDVSKYGTYVTRDNKKIKLSKNEKFLLKADDIVQFGLKETTFVVLHHSFVTVKSSLNEEELNKLKTIIDYTGGKLLETWENSCTHLTVAKSILFTTKLAYALAAAKPIITIAYWEAVNVAIEESKELPETEAFLPIVKEDWLKVSPRLFLPNEKRKTLFKGLSFVYFCVKQYYAYAPLITAAGGKSCVYPTKRPLTPRDLTAKNAIVVQQPVSDSTLLTQDIAADYQIVYQKLQAIKRRLVSETEIPLAVLYCNMEKYCNSKFDFATFLRSKSHTEFSPSDIIIEDTQNTGKIENRETKRKIIPETCKSQDSEAILKKARFESEQKNDSNVSKDTVKDTQQDANAKEITHKIIPETTDFQDSESISKKAYFSNESEQSNISDKSNIVSKIQNDENISEKNRFSEQSQIIIESCYDSLTEDVINNSSNRNEQKQVVIISKTCDFSEKLTNNFATEKEQQNAMQEKESFEKNNLIFAENNQQKNILQGNKGDLQQQENVLINEENNAIYESNNVFSIESNQKDRLQDDKFKSQQSKIIFMNEENSSEKNDLNHEKNNTTVEKNKVSTNSDKCENMDWENCKSSENSKKPRIISIQETDSIGIFIQRDNQKNKIKNILEKNCSKVEKSLLKEQNLNSAFNSERNQEDSRVTKDKIQETHVKNEGPRRKGVNWYNKYLNQEFTDEILRTDMPCGKRFTKTSIMIPKRILRVDDFIL